ncbi:MAG: SIS domain-containing protein, partial [Chloroflexota bacterium]
VIMSLIANYLQEIIQIIERLPHDAVQAIIDTLAEARDHQRTIFLMGNGGSGATASHMANDLIKNTIQPGKPRLKVIALTDNMPIILAIANDWDYSRIFVEQLVPLAQPGDVLLGLSGSGNSPNIIKAMDWARDNGLKTIGLTGRDGGQLKDKAELVLIVPTQSMAQIEDVHLILNHIFYLGLLEQ